MNRPKQGHEQIQGKIFARQYMPKKLVKRGFKVCNNIGIKSSNIFIHQSAVFEFSPYSPSPFV